MIGKEYCFLISLLFLALTCDASSQCSCFGASIGGLTPVGGTTNVGVLKKDNMRVNAFYQYSYGDNYYRGDMGLPRGDIDHYRAHFLSFNAGYGLSSDFTVEAELGLFAGKMQDFRYWKESMSGLSYMMVTGKYNVFHSIKSEFEFTAGLSVRAPFGNGKDTAFKFVNPSTGAWNFGLSFFVYKGYHKSGLHFFLINRTEMNTENEYDYTFGPANYTSFIGACELFPWLNGALELRNELRVRDYYDDKYAGDSGGDLLFLAPQLNFSFSQFNVSTIFNYPLYGWYNGEQLGNGFSASLNLSWQYSFTD